MQVLLQTNRKLEITLIHVNINILTNISQLNKKRISHLNQEFKKLIVTS